VRFAKSVKNETIISLSVQQKQDVERLIQEEVLPPYQQPLLGLIRPSIRLTTIPASEASIPLGSSKMGGLPDFSDGLAWPCFPNDQPPLWFVAQIKLSEVKPFDEEGLLPPRGILYFFVQYDEATVLYEPNEHAILQRVVLLPETKPGFWKRLMSKKKKQMYYPSCRLILSNVYTYPSYDSYHLERLQTQLQTNLPPSEAFQDSFWEKDGQTSQENEFTSRHQLLGYARGIQHEYFEGEVADVPTHDKELKSADYDQLLRWILLFQLDSDKNTNMCWGDWGKMYFFIERERLAKADFSNVRVTTQCY
jgi:uncharacterized protein YwqG